MIVARPRTLGGSALEHDPEKSVGVTVFSDQDHVQNKKVERDDDRNEMYTALRSGSDSHRGCFRWAMATHSFMLSKRIDSPRSGSESRERLSEEGGWWLYCGCSVGDRRNAVPGFAARVRTSPRWRTPWIR